MLSTHVLDLTRGSPAAGLRVQLFQVDEHSRTLLSEQETDADGRIAAPFGGALAEGCYELNFVVGEYFARLRLPTIYYVIPVRFKIELGQSYHIPLLLSPNGYSTYRGT